MPGWHDATRELQAEGKLQMLGIVQEQHPERARLFMQWKGMDWPLMVDSLDLLGVSVVPVTVAIDEHGIVREKGLRIGRAAEFAREFVAREYLPPRDVPVPPTGVADISRLKAQAIRSGSAENWRRYAEALTLWGGETRLGEAIQAWQSALAVAPDHAASHFGLGVTFRRRYDSADGRPEDFRNAVAAWSRALALDPNNYIWRRRIQQYGPRLDKPYPFYDWVDQARREIRGRGETPQALQVEPAGAELAPPGEQFEAPGEASGGPDPDERIQQDPARFVRVATTVVPPVLTPGRAARVHVVFRPQTASDAHWNNEAGELTLWVPVPAGWQVDRQRLTVANPAQRTSDETRRVEFELRAPEDAAPGPVTLPAYALYYVCEGVRGACLYRRQNIPLRVTVGE